MISLILSISSNADENSIYIQKDERAPFSGILTNVERSKIVAVHLIERDAYKSLSESYQKTNELLKNNIDLQEKKVNILLEQNDRLFQELKNSENTSDLEKLLIFGLGVITTIGAGFLVHEIAKTSN